MSTNKASISGCDKNAVNIIIPLSIEYANRNYFVTSILPDSFLFSEVQSIQFPNDSKLHIIHKNAFSFSKIKSIIISSSVHQLEDGWCSATKELEKVTIMPNNKYYKNMGEIVLGRMTNFKFDNLVFASRSIKSVKIPSNIRIISPYAFEHSSIEEIFIPSQVTTICDSAFHFCVNLSVVEFQTDSQLRIIEKCAFELCSIFNISIPSHVTKICKSSFSGCINLKNVEFQIDSELQTLEKLAFSGTALETFSIPASVCQLQGGCFLGSLILDKLTIMANNKYFKNLADNIVVGKSDPESSEYDILLFVSNKLKSFTIPSNIKIISENLFEESFIENVFITSQVTTICKYSFSASSIQCIDFQADSQLRIIEKNAFYHSSIESFYIPPHVTRIGLDAFYLCCYLQIIEIDDKSELLEFSLKNIEKNVIIMAPVKLHFIFSNFN